jgi:hypothetical protein
MKAKELLELESKNNLWSHAYLFVGQNRDVINFLLKYIMKERGIRKSDVEILEPEGIEGKEGEIKAEAIRQLIHRIYLSSEHGRLAVIYGAERLNQSSGNILLKTLEEPPENSTIILISANLSVLPTIKSRCRLIRIADSKIEPKSQKYEIAAIFGYDFARFSAEADKISKEDGAIDFLLDLENYFRAKLIWERKKSFAEAIKEIEETKKAIKNNANSRLLLENLYIKLKKYI